MAGAATGLIWIPTTPSIAASWPREWISGTIVFHADFLPPNHQLLNHELGRLCQLIPETIALPASTEKIHVYLFSRRTTFERYLERHFPNVPMRRALFIKQRGPGMVFAFGGDQVEIDLRHETTHAILHTMLPMVPLWLDEGLAEYFEVESRDRIAGNPHLPIVRRQLRWRRLPRLQTLETIDNLSGMTDKDYRTAWAWTHFLLHGPTLARHELRQYLADIHASEDPGYLSDRLARAIPNWNAAFRRHFEMLS